MIEKQKNNGKINIQSQIDTDKLIPIKSINKNDWNPNFVSTTILRAIEDDIIKNGFLEVVVLEKYNSRLKKKNVIINGEHRYLTIKKLVEDDLYELVDKEGNIIDPPAIPATVIDVNDKTAKALTIRLNREHGDLMPDKVGKLLTDISPNVDVPYLNDMLFLPETEILVLTDMAKTVALKDKDDKDKDKENDKLELQNPRDFLREKSSEQGQQQEIQEEEIKASISTTKQTTCPECGNTFLVSS